MHKLTKTEDLQEDGNILVEFNDITGLDSDVLSINESSKDRDVKRAIDIIKENPTPYRLAYEEVVYAERDRDDKVSNRSIVSHWTVFFISRFLYLLFSFLFIF